MSLLLNIANARKRWFDSAQTDSVDDESDARESFELHVDTHDCLEPHDNVFSLLPPASDHAESEHPESEHVEPAPIGRNVHPVDMTDLSRLSIDTDGRLYWDGKPVEVHRRLAMSREQIIGALVIGAFVAIGAMGALLQGTSAARDWACRFGWATSVCGPPSPPRSAFDIPA
jgi:hypothetical protein